MRATLDAELEGPDGGAFLAAIQSKARLLREGHAVGAARAPRQLRPAGLLFAGMGGSGATAGLVRDAVVRAIDLPFTIVKQYQFPQHVKKDWEVLAISHSGETEETLTVAREARRRGCHLTGFSADGTLKGLVDVHVPQPTGFAPRCALAHTWFSMLGYLEATGILPEKVPVADAVAAVEAVEARCGPAVPERDNPAKALARSLVQKVPQVYVTPAFEGVGVFFQSLLNENAKKIARVDVVPECNHNDFTGWGGDPMRRHFMVLMLSHANQHPEIRKRIDYMRQKYTEWGVPWQDLQLDAIAGFRDQVVQQVRAVHMLDYTSYYAAMLLGQDPNHIPEVRGLKEYIRKGS